MFDQLRHENGKDPIPAPKKKRKKKVSDKTPNQHHRDTGILVKISVFSTQEGFCAKAWNLVERGRHGFGPHMLKEFLSSLVSGSWRYSAPTLNTEL